MRKFFRASAPPEDAAAYFQATLKSIRRAAAIPVPPVGYPCDRATVLRWEKGSRLIYHAALMRRICLDVGLRHPVLEAFREKTIARLAEWPHWRPTGPNGEFDKNNWSNGYLPGAWGLLGGDTDTFIEKGQRWIERMPGAAHWRSRSTNHGIVIFATYLVGAKAAGAEPVVRDALREVVNEAFADGCYPEGVNYLFFAISELIPYLTATWPSCSSWREHVAHELPGIDGAKEMLLLSAGTTGKLRVTFGDVRGHARLYANSARALDSFSPRCDLSQAMQANRLLDDNRLAPLVRDLPKGGSPITGDRLFGIGMATLRTERWMLWVIGSRMHRTHNRDHDCGSFFFERDGELLVGELMGREAWKHSVPLLSDAIAEPEVPYGALGDNDNGFTPRRSHGRLARRGAFWLRVWPPPTFSNNASTIHHAVRDFHVFDDCLLVIDRLEVDGEGRPVIQFVTQVTPSTLFALERSADRVWCEIRKFGNIWISATVIGSDYSLLLEGQLIICRGRRFPIPPDPRDELLYHRRKHVHPKHDHPNHDHSMDPSAS